MYLTMQASQLVHCMDCLHHYNNQQLTCPIEPPDKNYVLDLSTKAKRIASPDYTYCYPSPKASPSQSFEEDNLMKSCNKIITRTPNVSVSPPQGLRHTEISVCHQSPSAKSVDDLSETFSEVSYRSSDISSSPKTKSKIVRPFKSLGKDSLSLSINAINHLHFYSTSSFLIDEKDFDPEETRRLMEESAQKYIEFKEKMLGQLGHDNKMTNQNMKRMQSNGSKINDPEYLEKRRKNNEAAKKSRDSRRSKQDEIAIRATFLEQENMMLKYKVQSEIQDLERIRKIQLLSERLPC